MDIENIAKLVVKTMNLSEQGATNAIFRELAMERLGLSWNDAVQYAMERTYNQMSHNQAMSEINKQKEGK
jgi:hypothetical protein